MPALGNELVSGTGMELYFAAGESFRALGDANGLFVILQQGVASWADRRRWSEFPTRAAIRSPRSGRFTVEGKPYRVDLGT